MKRTGISERAPERLKPDVYAYPSMPFQRQHILAAPPKRVALELYVSGVQSAIPPRPNFYPIGERIS